MQRALTEAGYTVWNVDYPSRTSLISKLADDAIGKALAQCRQNGATKIDFVTHSMGGILVRSYLARHSMPDLGRVVMLAPPNQGSELVDKLSGFKIFKWINGPAGNEMGTDRDSLPNLLGPANFPLGIIAGDRSINWINSLLIPGPDDGKVSVERAKLAGMTDFLVVHATHPLIMRNREVIRQTIAFLRNGKFNGGQAGSMKSKSLPCVSSMPKTAQMATTMDTAETMAAEAMTPVCGLRLLKTSVRGTVAPRTKFGTVVATVARMLVPNCSAATVMKMVQ
jgi:triacylglycerol lipase